MIIHKKASLAQTKPKLKPKVKINITFHPNAMKYNARKMNVYE